MKNVKWNLKNIFKSQRDWDKKLTQFRSLVDSFGQKTMTVDSVGLVKSVLRLEKKLDTINNQLSLYIALKTAMNPSSETLKFKDLEHGTICNAYQRYCFDFEYAVLGLSKGKQKQYLNSPELRAYKPRLEQIILPKSNSTKKEEKILNHIEPIKDEVPNIYSTVLNKNVSYRAIHVEDSVMKVAPKNLKKLETSRNKSVRRNTYLSRMNGEAQTQVTHAQTLSHHFQLSKVFSETRKYPCAFDYVFKDEKLKEKMAYDILDVVLYNKPLISDFIKHRKKVLNIKNYCSYDDKVESYDYKISVSKAYNEVLKSFENFSPESVAIVKRLKKNKHLYITDSAEAATSFYGFCMRIGDSDPYVFSYFQNDLDSAMTLAHELGHAIHETKLNKHNDFWNKDTSLVIHETASYTHELVFLMDLLKRTTNKKTRKKILAKLVKYYYDVMYKKAAHSKYELALSKQAAKNRSFDPRTLSKKYSDVDDEFFGGIRSKTKCSDKEWIGNERLFWDFYELKYIIAFALASRISQKVLEGNTFYKKQFQNLMKMGDETEVSTHFEKFNMKPSDIPDLVQEAFDKMEELLEELKELD